MHFIYRLSFFRHYTCPPEQRQILRIIYMPPIYAVISFLSYRFFRSYTYYDLIEVGASVRLSSHRFAIDTGL